MPTPTLLPDYPPGAYGRFTELFDTAFRNALDHPVDELGKMFDYRAATPTFMRHALDFLGCEPLWAPSTGAGVAAARVAGGGEAMFAHDGFIYTLGGRSWGVWRTNPNTGNSEEVGVLSGSRGDDERILGAAVVGGVPYVSSRIGTNKYLNRLDIGALTATRVGAITPRGSWTPSLVSDGATLWEMRGANLTRIDTDTAAATSVRTVGGIDIAPGSNQLQRLPAACAFYAGQIYAMYHQPTGTYRFNPAAGDAVRLPLALSYDSAEALGGAIYAISGRTLYRMDPLTGGHDDFFDLAYHRRILQRGRWWVRYAGFPVALRVYLNDILGLDYSEQVRRNATGRPLGVTINLSSSSERTAALLNTPAALEHLSRRAIPFLIANLVEVDAVRTIAPITTTIRYGIATTAIRFGWDR